MEHPMKGTPLRGIAVTCKCGKGCLLAIETEEEVLMRATHDGEEDHEIAMAPGQAMAFAIDLLGPVMYGMKN